MDHLLLKTFSRAGDKRRMMNAAAFIVALVLLFVSTPTAAYDGPVRNQMRARGLWIASNNNLAFRSTAIDLSPSKVTVRYVIENVGKREVASTLYFELPPIGAEHADNQDAFVWKQDNNPTGLALTVDGAETGFSTSQRAVHRGIDITETLKTSNLPLIPFGDALDEKVKTLSKNTRNELRERGILGPRSADWQLATTHYWRQTFLPHTPVTIEISYKPVMTELVESFMLWDGKLGLGIDDEPLDFLCLSKEQLSTIANRYTKLDPNKHIRLYTIRAIDYDLLNITDAFTAINALSFTIRTRNPEDIVSVCGGKFERAGPQELKWQERISHETGRIKIHFLEPKPSDPHSQRPGENN